MSSATAEKRPEQPLRDIRQQRFPRISLFRSRRLAWITTPLLILLFLGAWDLYVRGSGVSSLVLPGPLAVGGALWEQILTPHIWTEHLMSTLTAILAGFALALVVGVTLGFIVGKSTVLENMMRPFIVVTQVIPKVTLIPLFVLWLGFGAESKILIAALLAFFPFFVNTVFGIRSVPSSMRDLMRSLSSGRIAMTTKVDFPSTLPFVFAAAELAIVQATIGVIVAEYLGGEHGLGRYAITMQATLETESLFGAIIIMAALGLALYSLVGLIRRASIPWHETVRNT